MRAAPARLPAAARRVGGATARLRAHPGRRLHDGADVRGRARARARSRRSRSCSGRSPTPSSWPSCNAHPQWRRDRVAPRVRGPRLPRALAGRRRASRRATQAAQPVTRVSWFAADAYCEAQGARLPRWLEWEYVAAADATRRDARARSGLARAHPRLVRATVVERACRASARRRAERLRRARPARPGLGMDRRLFGAARVAPTTATRAIPTARSFCGAGALSVDDREQLRGADARGDAVVARRQRHDDEPRIPLRQGAAMKRCIAAAVCWRALALRGAGVAASAAAARLGLPVAGAAHRRTVAPVRVERAARPAAARVDVLHVVPVRLPDDRRRRQGDRAEPDRRRARAARRDADQPRSEARHAAGAGAHAAASAISIPRAGRWRDPSRRTCARSPALLGIRYRALADGEFNHTTVLVLLDAEGRVLARTEQVGGLPDPAFLAAVRQTLAPPH